MSTVYTSKPTVSKQTGAKKPAQKPGTSTKNTTKPNPSQPTAFRRASVPVRPRPAMDMNSNRRLSGPRPRPTGGIYGMYGENRQQQDVFGQNHRRQDLSPERGRGPGTFGDSTTANDDPYQEQGNGSPPERRLEYRGGYSVIPPNEKKRQAIQAQARKEEEEYTRYKEEKKPGRVAYVGTVGGGVPEGEARALAVMTQSQSKYSSLQKRQQYRDEARMREDMQYQEKKMQARQQSDLNAQREKERQRKLDRDRRMKNEAFLDRLERK